MPGLLLSIYAWRTPDPTRRAAAHPDVLGSLGTLAGIRPYRWVLLAGVLVIFASGAFITWGTEFAIRYLGLSLRRAALMIATTILVGGVLGVLSGGWLADWLQQRWVWGRSVTIGVSLLLAVPFLVMTLYSPGIQMLVITLLLASYFLSFYHGPATAVIHDITPESMHGSSYALYIFLTHMIGDMAAPALVGKMADLWSLRVGLLVAVGVQVLGALAFLAAALFITRCEPRPPQSPLEIPTAATKV